MMHENHHNNIEMLQSVCESLEELVEEVVFVGGSVASTYVDLAIAEEIRPTIDVDCVIEVTNLFDYNEIEKRLRKKGFKNDTREDAPVCRYISPLGVTVDVMPNDESLLGFSNSWYYSGIKNKVEYTLPNGKDIYTFDLGHFLASKVEAFHGRGSDDPRFSHDLEDVVLVLDGTEDVLDKLNSADSEVLKFLKQTAKDFLKNFDIQEAIIGHLSHSAGKVDAINKIFESLK